MIKLTDDMQQMKLANEDYDELSVRAIEMGECEVEKCTFRQGDLMNGSFREVVFRNTDLSGCNLSRCSFREVQFDNCRLIGADMSEAFLQNVTFTNCNCEYLNLSNAKLKRAAFEHVKLKNAFIESVTHDNTTFADSDLSESEWFKTRMKGLDVSTCQITGLRAGEFELYGVKIDVMQAAQLVGLFGILIK